MVLSLLITFNAIGFGLYLNDGSDIVYPPNVRF